MNELNAAIVQTGGRLRNDHQNWYTALVIFDKSNASGMNDRDVRRQGRLYEMKGEVWESTSVMNTFELLCSKGERSNAMLADIFIVNVFL